MALILAHTTDNPAQAVTLYSLLQSGGFHPEIFNFHHGFIAIAHIYALGGFRIMLPENEIKDAIDFINSTEPTPDSDPIKPRLLRDIIYGSILTLNPFFGLLLLPIYILATAYILLFVGLAFLQPSLIIPILLTQSLGIYIILMLAHAKYIAVPALRKTHDLARPL